MKIELDEARRGQLTGALQSLFAQEFDEDLSAFQAEQVVDLMLKTLAPVVYNQAVQDVRAHLQGKLDDLDGEIYIDPGL